MNSFSSVSKQFLMLTGSLLMTANAAFAESNYVCSLKGDQFSAIQRLCPVSEGLAAFKINGRWGYMDAQGRVQIEPRFLVAGPVKNGVAVAQSEDTPQLGLINTRGEWIVQPRLGGIGHFFDGLAWAEEFLSIGQTQRGFINHKGEWVIRLPSFATGTRFNHGYAWIKRKQNDPTEFIDTQGHVVNILSPDFRVDTTANSFGNYSVSIDPSPLLRNIDGRQWNLKGEVIPLGARVSEDLLIYARSDPQTKADLYGSIDPNGDIVTPFIFETLQSFRSGVAIAQLPDSPEDHSLSDPADEVPSDSVAEASDSAAAATDAARAAVMVAAQVVGEGIEEMPIRDGHRGLIDTRGQWLAQPIYSSIRPADHYYFAYSQKLRRLDIYDLKAQLTQTLNCPDQSEDDLYYNSIEGEGSWHALSWCDHPIAIAPDHQLKTLHLPGSGNITFKGTQDHLLISRKKSSEDDQESKKSSNQAASALLLDVKGNVVWSSEQIPKNFKPNYFNLFPKAANEVALPLMYFESEQSVAILTPDFQFITNEKWESIWTSVYETSDTTAEGPVVIQTKENRYGAIDAYGQWLIPDRYLQLRNFYRGLSQAEVAPASNDSNQDQDDEPTGTSCGCGMSNDKNFRIVDIQGKEWELPPHFHFHKILSNKRILIHNEDEETFVYDLEQLRSTAYSDSDSADEPTYYKGLAIKEQDGQTGLVNKSGQWVFGPRSNLEIRPDFSENTGGESDSYESRFIGWKTSTVINRLRMSGTAPIDVQGWINAEGKEIIAPYYDDLDWIDSGDFAIGTMKDDGDSLLDVQGRVIWKASDTRSALKPIGDGWFQWTPHTQHGLLNAKGDWIVPLGAISFEDIPDEHFAVMNFRRDIIFANGAGQVSTRQNPLNLPVDQPEDWWAESVNTEAGPSLVWYGVDFKERLNVSGALRATRPFRHGVSPISLPSLTQEEDDDGVLALLNSKGQVIATYPGYSDIGEMQNGLASLSKSEERSTPSDDEYPSEANTKNVYGFINQQGQMVIEPQFDAVTYFQEDRALVLKNHNLGMIDSAGRTMVRGSWLCGKKPVLINADSQVIWPTNLANQKSCQ